MKSNNIPSFLVIFLLVEIKSHDKRAAIIIKNRALTKGDKSLIWNGNNKPINPNTKVEQTITDPIKSPNTSQFSCFLAAKIEK